MHFINKTNAFLARLMLTILAALPLLHVLILPFSPSLIFVFWIIDMLVLYFFIALTLFALIRSLYQCDRELRKLTLLIAYLLLVPEQHDLTIMVILRLLHIFMGATAIISLLLWVRQYYLAHHSATS